jgi:hypothetical protein
MTKIDHLDKLAELLNDPNTSRIGDPTAHKYVVALVVDSVGTAVDARIWLGRVCTDVKVSYWDGGPSGPQRAYVNVYDVDDQRKLFDAVGSRLTPARHALLERLVRARGPVPDEYIEHIQNLRREGVPDEEIARRMNDARAFDGVKGGIWTAAKLRRICPRRAAAA